MARKYTKHSPFVQAMNGLIDYMEKKGITLSIDGEGNLLFTVGVQEGVAVDAEDIDNPVCIWPPLCEVKYLVADSH